MVKNIGPNSASHCASTAVTCGHGAAHICHAVLPTMSHYGHTNVTLPCAADMSALTEPRTENAPEARPVSQDCISSPECFRFARGFQGGSFGRVKTPKGLNTDNRLRIKVNST
eukprot:1189659-Prorocentrum_minimum.AAC.2